MSIPLILLLVTVIAWFVCLPKIFAKAGENASAGFIPGYNFYVWQKITDRPWWWILILIVPGVNLLMLIIMHVQLSWSFGKRDTMSTILAIIVPFFMLYKLAFDKDISYTENIDWNTRKKGTVREWSDAILFALIAAFIIRTFTFEAFTIPTPSMEESMLVGDYLFVNKLKYGTRIPNTPIAFPLAHHTLPVLNTKAYLEWMKLDYNRLPGWSDVNRGDAVVFNFPEGDTVIVQQQNRSFYEVRREKAFAIAGNSEEKMIANEAKYLKKAQAQLEKKLDIVVRPTDKKENYVKRCVGIAGDKLEIVDGELYIDGQLQDQYGNTQRLHFVETEKAMTPAFRKKLKKKLGINIADLYSHQGKVLKDNRGRIMFHLTKKQAEELAKLDWVKSIEAMNDKKEDAQNRTWAIFPNVPGNDWTKDNFGPIVIPAKGMTVELSKENIDLYRRVITAYEGNSLSIKNGEAYINGEKVSTYTFEMDYYWMMGDNRHNSQDSRYWGFVPEDHIVGQAAFVWFSRDKELGMTEKGGIRWNRLFTKVR